jgi:hypothetical protein
MSSVLSLYIPILTNNVSEEYIKKMFLKHNIGKILRVDFVRNNLKSRIEAFLHFDEWFDSDEAVTLKENVLNPSVKAKLMYYNDKFWPLLENKNPHKRVENPNYEILNKSEYTNVYANSLNLFEHIVTNNHDAVKDKLSNKVAKQ